MRKGIPVVKPSQEGCSFSFYGNKGVCFFGTLTDSLGETSYNTNNEFEIIITLRNDIKESLAKSTLLHELFETAIRLQRCVYQAENGNNSDVFYLFRHNELDMICEEIFPVYEEVSKFITEYYKNHKTDKK